jgi:transcriptional regulator with XRE-family HTH domain
MGYGYFVTNSGEYIPVGAAPHITGEDILEFRRIRRVTQQALAMHLGIGIRTLRTYEAAGKLPILNKAVCREIEALKGAKIARFTDDPN